MTKFGKAKGGGRRKSARAPAPLLAVLSTVANDHRVGLVNVSSRGVRVTAPELPVEGEEVIFRAERVQSYGQVVWSAGGQCGVAFESPIAAEEVERLRRQANISDFGNVPTEK